MDPISTTKRYVIMRFDLYHIEGVLEGAYVDLQPAREYLDALRNTAKDTSSFFNAVGATFLLFEATYD